MSQELIAQWKDRVVEAESELQCVKDDLETVTSRKLQLQTAIDKHQSSMDSEKRTTASTVHDAEKSALELTRRCEEAHVRKCASEKAYFDTVAEYERLHYLVKDVKDQEHQLATRKNPEQLLGQESLVWAEEEHQLRSQLQHIDRQLRDARGEQKKLVADLERKLAEEESHLMTERKARDPGARPSSLVRPPNAKDGSRKRDVLGDVSNA